MSTMSCGSSDACSEHGADRIAGQMTVGDLQMICGGTDAESRAACRFYILGVT